MAIPSAQLTLTEPSDRQEALYSGTTRKKLLRLVFFTIAAVFMNFLSVLVSFAVWEAIHRLL